MELPELKFLYIRRKIESGIRLSVEDQKILLGQYDFAERMAAGYQGAAEGWECRAMIAEAELKRSGGPIGPMGTQG